MPSRHSLICWTLGCLLLAGFLLQGLELGRHLIWTVNDSLHTAERSRQMLLSSNPLTVKRNFYPDHKKPPLHYWLTAPLMLQPDTVLALLAWPLLFGALSLILSGILASQLWPQEKGMALWTMAFLASSLLFIQSSSVALLDTGMTAFLLLTAVAYEMARQRPWAWWLVGAGITLGFLQKLPLGLFYLGVILWADKWQKIPAAPRGNSHFRFSCWCWGIAAMIWPLSQTLWFGRAFGRRFFFAEMIDRIGMDGTLEKATTWTGSIQLWKQWPFAMTLALAGLAFFCLVRKKPAVRHLAGPTIWAAAYLFFVLMFMPRERYLLPALPWLAFFAVWFLFRVCGHFRLPVVWVGSCVLLLSFLHVRQVRAAWLEQPLLSEKAGRKQWYSQVAKLGGTLRELRQPGEAAIFFQKNNIDAHQCSGISFFASQPDPVFFWAPLAVQPKYKKSQLPEGQSILLLTRPEDLELHPDLFSGLKPVQSCGDYVFYRADAAAVSRLGQRNN